LAGVLGGGKEDVIVTGIILRLNGIGGGTGADVIVPVTVVTPFASGPLIDPGVKLTVGSPKLTTGAAPNPVPVIVTGVLSPELMLGEGLVGITGGDNFNVERAQIPSFSPSVKGSMDPPTQATIVVERVFLGGWVMTYSMALGLFGSGALITPGATKSVKVGMKLWPQDDITLFCGLVGPSTFAAKLNFVPSIASKVVL
jgi:hypothetical protein